MILSLDSAGNPLMDDIDVKLFSLSLLLEPIRNVLYNNYAPKNDLIIRSCNGVIKGCNPGSGI